MRTRRERTTRWIGRALGNIILAASIAVSVPQASANTYLFSVTGGEILSALSDPGVNPGWESVSSSAFFSMFLQPFAVSSYTYLNQYSPNDNAPATAWDATTI